MDLHLQRNEKDKNLNSYKNIILVSLNMILIFIQLHSHSLLLPKHSESDIIIEHTAYTLKYNEQHEQAEWVAYRIDASELSSEIERTDDFRSDPNVKTGSASLSDYKGSGYDRGHLAPAGIMKTSEMAMSESFYMSNMSPMNTSFNRGIWKRLENQVKDWSYENHELHVVTGPLLTDNLQTIGESEVSVPDYYYKVILDYQEPEIKGIGFLLPNEKSSDRLGNYALPIDYLELILGIDFFPELQDSIENKIESNMDLIKWDLFSDNPKKPLKDLFKTQCNGTTQKGSRCKRPIHSSSVYCWQHQPETETNSEPVESETVYITKTGKKYHKSGCSSLRRSKKAVSLREAQKIGLSLCKRCKPDQ